MANDASMSAQVANNQRTITRTIRNDKRNLFTGKRRPKIKKICPCCNKQFTTTDPRKLYKNETHRKRMYRARMADKIKKDVIE